MSARPFGHGLNGVKRNKTLRGVGLPPFGIETFVQRVFLVETQYSSDRESSSAESSEHGGTIGDFVVSFEVASHQLILSNRATAVMLRPGRFLKAQPPGCECDEVLAD